MSFVSSPELASADQPASVLLQVMSSLYSLSIYDVISPDVVTVTLDLVPVPSYQVKCEDNHNELPTASAVYHRRLSPDLDVERVMALLSKCTNAFNKISLQSSLHTFHQLHICSAIQASPLYVLFVILQTYHNIDWVLSFAIL